jgi:hypothetical protein
VFSLLRAVQDWKAGLIDRGEELDEVQRDALSFLRKRGSTFLFVSAVAASMRASTSGCQYSSATPGLTVGPNESEDRSGSFFCITGQFHAAA